MMDFLTQRFSSQVSILQYTVLLYTVLLYTVLLYRNHAQLLLSQIISFYTYLTMLCDAHFLLEPTLKYIHPCLPHTQIVNILYAYQEENQTIFKQIRS